MSDIKRYTLIDVLRGFSVLSMIIYHTVWDLVYIYNIDMPWYSSVVGNAWQASIYVTFILLSAFCWNMGRKRLKRGLTVFIGSCIISAVTVLLMPENSILFGILFLIGSAMLILIVLDKVFRKIPPVLGFFISIFIFVLLLKINDGIIGVGNLHFSVSKTLYANAFTAAFGFPGSSFSSMDYFPLLPWLFLYFAGYFLYFVFKKYDWLKYLTVISFKPLEFIGRHSLLIYMLHQPIIYGVLYIVFLAIAAV